MAIVKTKIKPKKKPQSQFRLWEAHTQSQVCLTFFPSASVSSNTILKPGKHSEAMSYFLSQKFFSVCPSQGTGFTCGGVRTTEGLLRPLWLAARRCSCTPAAAGASSRCRPAWTCYDVPGPRFRESCTSLCICYAQRETNIPRGDGCLSSTCEELLGIRW